jgi:PAS domain S-box-containing protein
MHSQAGNFIAKYSLAVLLTFLGVFARALLTPILGDGAPFLILYPAVALAALFGGLGGGLTVTFLGTLSAAFFLISPYYTLDVKSNKDLAQLVVFLLMGGFISWLVADRQQIQSTFRILTSKSEREALAKAEALRESEERLRLAQKTAKVGIWDLNLQTNEAIWSEGTYELLGLQKTDDALTVINWNDYIHPEDRHVAAQIIERMLAENTNEFYAEFRAARVDGEMRWFATNGYLIRAADGTPQVLRGINYDITDRKKADQERERQLQAEQALRQQAEEASRLKDEFLATVSHELRTPLNSILGWAQMLQNGRLTDEETKAKAIETIERSARAQAQLIEDILDVSRIVTGKVRLNVAQFDLPPVVQTAVESLRPAAENKGITVETVIDHTAGAISGDADRIQQIVWNLLSNAIKFNLPDGKVTVALKSVGSNIEITVADTGKGIDPNFLPFVFDRFRQADGSMTRLHGGLGLGLSIVRYLVELHGGTVSVASEGKNKGSVFTVLLPRLHTNNGAEITAKPNANETNAPSTADCSQLLQGVRILVVDDEPDARFLLRQILENCTAEVETADTAEEGLQKAAEWKPHLIVSDIGMPAKDGFQFIQELRSREKSAGGWTPAIALSAYARSEDRTRAFHSGFQMHLSKPIEPNELTAAIAGLIQRNKV